MKKYLNKRNALLGLINADVSALFLIIVYDYINRSYHPWSGKLLAHGSVHSWILLGVVVSIFLLPPIFSAKKRGPENGLAVLLFSFATLVGLYVFLVSPAFFWLLAILIFIVFLIFKTIRKQAGRKKESKK